MDDREILEIFDEADVSIGRRTAIWIARRILAAQAESAEPAPVANADFCPHCNPCRNGERIAKAERLNIAYDEVLRDLASYVGCGGYNSFGLIDPKVAQDKIRFGIDHLHPQPQSADVAELVKALEKIEAWLRRFTKGRAMIHGAEEHANIASAALAKHGGK